MFQNNISVIILIGRIFVTQTQQYFQYDIWSKRRDIVFISKLFPFNKVYPGICYILQLRTIYHNIWWYCVVHQSPGI